MKPRIQDLTPKGRKHPGMPRKAVPYINGWINEMRKLLKEGPTKPLQESLETEERDDYGFSGDAFRKVGWSTLEQAHARFRVLEKALKDGESILDIGCGNGLLYEYLMGCGRLFHYRGVERSKSFVEEFYGRFPETFSWLRISNILEEAVEEEQADWITSFGLSSDMYGGFRDLDKLFRNIKKKFRKGFMMDFWDADKFQSVGTPGAPMVWKLGDVVNFVNKQVPAFDVVAPISGRDFMILGYTT